MDKLFWKLKENVRIQKGKAKLVHHGFISKSKIPLITRYAMNAMSSKDIQSAFSATGIYPLDRSKISPDKLIGDHEPDSSTSTDMSQCREPEVEADTSSGHTGSVLMDVFDENDNAITQMCTVTRNASTQTIPIKSLPCSSCIEYEVSLHPAVAEGYVDVTFASEFIDSAPTTTTPTKKRKLSRDTSKDVALLISQR